MIECEGETMNKEEIKRKAMQMARQMYGRDDLGRFLFVVAIVCIVANLFVKHVAFLIVANVCMILDLLRIFSKNYVKRRIENERYLKIYRKVTRWFKVRFKNVKDKQHKTLLCPTCVQMVRIPKGKGKIVVTCPNCKSKFDAKS